MNRVNIKNLCVASAFLVLGLMILLILGFSENINLDSILKWFPTAITIYGILLLIFTELLWKCRIFQRWLVLIPNLNGKWSGRLKYKFPEDAEKFKSKKIKATIKQDLFNISVIIETNEMKSTSYVGAFDINKGQNRKRLNYSYTSKPRPEFRENSPMHEGTCLLDISGKPPNKLSGEYWTTRKTIGSIELNKKTN